MQLSKMIIYSLDPQALSAFLSVIFETEINPNEGSISLSSQDINFEVKGCDAEAEGPKSDRQLLEFLLDEDQSLASVKQKIEFYCYRHEMDGEKIIIEEGLQHLLIQDPDGRNWRFSSRNQQ